MTRMIKYLTSVLACDLHQEIMKKLQRLSGSTGRREKQDVIDRHGLFRVSCFIPERIAEALCDRSAYSMRQKSLCTFPAISFSIGSLHFVDTTFEISFRTLILSVNEILHVEQSLMSVSMLSVLRALLNWSNTIREPFYLYSIPIESKTTRRRTTSETGLCDSLRSQRLLHWYEILHDVRIHQCPIIDTPKNGR